ncbi:HBL/NHE enterotoxin family protein [Aeromonas salmonicida]|uniref:HBL/NHE enterotoxin family protein n=1 Tax=Aeromonas salmonicida TaxID=645 RepID=UPI002796520D|nr:HBL/NHE enterotoxin family protein [Aeromonas salmonicida]MDQ1884251.1 HBL/NHE enterotoxin family protein [Aeromonas salmonicida]
MLVTDSGNLTSLKNAQRDRVNAGQLIQNYCDTVLKAVTFDLKSKQNPDLARDEKRANDALDLAKQSAQQYQNTIFKAMITALGDAQTFCNGYSAIASSMTNATIKDWTTGIGILQQTADASLVQERALETALGDFLKTLQVVSGEFNAVSTSLGSKDGAFAKVISDAQSNIKSLNSKIAGLITGVVLSGLAIVGGGIIAIFGAVTAQPWAVVGGLALLGVGVAGEVVSDLGLAKALETKAKELEKIQQLEDEQKAIHNVSNELTTLVEVTNSAVLATHAVANGWSIVQGNLKTFEDNLRQERDAMSLLRDFYLSLNAHQISDLKQQTTFLEQQISSVQTMEAPKGVPLAQYVKQVVAEHQAA